MEMDNDIEFRSPEEIAAYQDGLLRKAVAYMAEKSPYYRRAFASAGVSPYSS